MSLLTAQDLSKSFGPKTILEHVTLTIRDDERVGLLGNNGTGKSTLARILAGIELADSGVVMRRREATVAYLAQEPEMDPERTPRQEVLAGLGPWSDAKDRHDAASAALTRGDGDMAALLAAQASAAADVERHGGWTQGHAVDSMLGHLGLARPDVRIATLSGGDRRRVALARILIAKPHLAILDEPSNHLDADTVAWLEKYLAEEYGGALLLVTHDRYLLDRVVTRTIELERGTIYSYDGGYEDYLEAKAERSELAGRTESNRQNFLRRELEWLRRQPKARTGKQKARIGRAEGARDAPPPRAQGVARLSIDKARSGKTVLETHKLSLAHGDRVLVRDLDLILSPGERLGIVGPNGSGKTTLLKAILGEHAPSAGTLTVGKNAKIAYFDQHRAGLDDAMSIHDNVAGDRSRIMVGDRETEIMTYLEGFLFRVPEQRQPVGSLSGGERARVALAKMLSYPSNLILLDEPTNDLDVAMLGALEEMLVETTATAIVVTHDRWFLDRIATSILAFEGDGRVVRYAGNYQIYTAQKPSLDKPSAAKAEEPSKTQKPAEKPKTKLSYAEQKELAGLLDRIDEAETAVKTLEGELADPALYTSRGDEVPALVAKLDAARAEVARLSSRWELLEEKQAGGSST